MTGEAKKSIKAAAGVFLCLAAVAVGAVLRDRVDLSASDRVDLSTLVASNSKTTDLPETKFFEDMMELLEQKYVDPIPDERKLADGAVRGMVASLGDPNSLYMDPDQYRVYHNVALGKYEGIGADLVLTKDHAKGKVQTGGPDELGDSDARLPKLAIAAIVPGSPADKAGLKPGDWVEFVNDHWVPNSDAFDRFLAAQDAVMKAKILALKDPSQVPAYQKTADEYLELRKKLRDEADKNILPIKARDQLMMGTTGQIKVMWVHGDRHLELLMNRGSWTMPGFGAEPDGSIRVPFVKGTADKLREALSGKSEATLDLRNNVSGDFDSMLECLKVVAPNGVYGYEIADRDVKPETLEVSDGVKDPIKLTLKVDETTRGTAEIFANALASRQIAKLEGPTMAGDPFVIRWYSLPDGAGYTLVTAKYSPRAPGVVANDTPSPSSEAEKDRLDRPVPPVSLKPREETR